MTLADEWRCVPSETGQHRADPPRALGTRAPGAKTMRTGASPLRSAAHVQLAPAACARAFGLRQARYRGPPMVHLQHVATAAALSLARLAARLAGRPLAPTPVAPFARLAA